MVNFGLLTAEIHCRVWGTPANFNGFYVLVALLHGTLVVGVSQTLRRWTDGATCIRQGDHHRVPTNLENRELSGNFVNMEKSGNFRYGQGFFVTCHMVCDLLIDELIFASLHVMCKLN